MADFLARMARNSRQRVDDARRNRSEGELLSRVRSAPGPHRLALNNEGFDLIAEYKPNSPGSTRGTPSAHIGDPSAYVRECHRAGAAAISVLTEAEHFGGSLDQLENIASYAHVPLMRKDFLVDPYQVLEARAAGASGVLLILRILDRHQLAEMIQAAAELDLFILLEIFDRHDADMLNEALLEAARLAVPVLAGVNCRNLRTLRANTSRFASMAARLPGNTLLVAESGIVTPEDARMVAELGYSLVLVGNALMRARHPGQLISEMIQAGRREIRGLCAYA